MIFAAIPASSLLDVFSIGLGVGFGGMSDNDVGLTLLILVHPTCLLSGLCADQSNYSGFHSPVDL